MIAWPNWWIVRGIVLGLLTVAPAGAADTQFLHIRLRTPVSTLASSSGQLLIAEVTRPLVHDHAILIPVHSTVYGTVARVKPVGLGIRRERASLELAFTHWRAPQGEVWPLDATLARVENAREQVDRRGRIQGILAANNPLGIVRGVWYKPSPQLLLRPAGIAGTPGTVLSRVALGPTGALGLLGARMLLTRLPEPEIDFPAGTEFALNVVLLVNASWSDEAAQPSNGSDWDQTMLSHLRHQPADIRKPNGTLVPDVINLAFIATGTSIDAAFRAAGWSEAELLTRKSFGRAYKAFVERKGYPSAPVSTLHYQGREPDLVFQKSLNSIAKRHHIRLWRLQGPSEEETWVGAASHDITVTFDRETFGLSHRIDPRLDMEREKVVSDLGFVDAVLNRMNMSRELQLLPPARTDGSLAILRLKDPATMEEVATPPGPAPRAVRRLLRRTILETRQYMLRENVYYLAFMAARNVIARRQFVVDPNDGQEVAPVF